MLRNNIMMNSVAVPDHEKLTPKRHLPLLEVEGVHPKLSKRQRIRSVKWVETPYVYKDERKSDEYDHAKIWYSRQEYNEFLEDRLNTIKNFRDAGGDVGILDPSTDCLRGLEPFQTVYTNQDMHSKRQFHQNTIILEQMRQARLGIKDPDRFRLLVSSRSELALMKAQEQAAIDQHEVHNTVGRRGSLITNMMVRNNLKTVGSNNQSLSLSESIRALQEQNARKLMQIYQNSWNGLSRFPIRRDSLFGSNMGNEIGGPLAPTMRFPIRRDSLG